MINSTITVTPKQDAKLYSHQWYLVNKERMREIYNQIGEKQDWKCAICLIPMEKLKVRLSVDHNHITNKVRGLLCRPCNVMLGMGKENQDVFLSAIKYLIKYV